MLTNGTQELIGGAVGGAVLVLLYRLYVAYPAGNASGAFTPDLVPQLLIGALSGVAAVWVRSWTGSQ